MLWQIKFHKSLISCRFVACNLVLEYTLSASVCARAATSYGATLLGFKPEDAMVSLGALKLDFFAVAVTALLGLLLSVGTKESSSFNTGRPLSTILTVVTRKNVMGQCFAC